MQGERSSLNSFHETIDLNQGSFPSNTSMNHSTSWDGVVNPVEHHLSDYMPAPADNNINSVNATNNRPQIFSGWQRGESSSGANIAREHTPYDDFKMRLGCLSSSSSYSVPDASTDSWSFEPSDFDGTSCVGNQVSGRSSNVQNYTSVRDSLNASSSHGHLRNIDSPLSLETCSPHTLSKSGQVEASSIPSFYASSTMGASSGSSDTLFEINNASGLSMGSWGSSCKRKTLEGTSGQFYLGGSSSSSQPVGNTKQIPSPGCYTASENVRVSSEPLNLSLTNRVEHVNSRNGVGISRVMPPVFHSSSFSGIAESSGRNSSVRSNLGYQESVRFDPHRGGPLRPFSTYSVPQLPRLFSGGESSELRSPVAPPTNPNPNPNSNPNPSNNLNPSHMTHLYGERGIHYYPWNGSYSLRGGGSSSSCSFPGERDSAGHEEVNTRSFYPEFSMSRCASDTRRVPEAQIDWSFTPGTSSSSRHQPPASRIGPGSGGRSPSVVWLPHQMQRSQTHQRPSEFAPWNPVPHVESDSSDWRNQYTPPPWASLSEEEVIDRLAQQESDQRSPPFLMDIPPSDDTHDWRAFAAVEGRHRLIRQVLNAMRRGVHLHPEDYMLIDPFLNGVAEVHDRHRDLRLDVDNMSYEELLALEERIGNVSTGLSEEKILGCMKQRKYRAVEFFPSLEPCCICREDYVHGEDIAILDCAHEYHVACIKQWLMQKNLCPICKTTALETT